MEVFFVVENVNESNGKQNNISDRIENSTGNETEQKNEQIKEMGSLDLQEDSSCHRIKLITISGEIGGMSLCPAVQRRRNTSIFSLCLRKSRTIRR